MPRKKPFQWTVLIYGQCMIWMFFFLVRSMNEFRTSPYMIFHGIDLFVWRSTRANRVVFDTILGMNSSGTKCMLDWESVRNACESLKKIPQESSWVEKFFATFLLILVTFIYRWEHGAVVRAFSLYWNGIRFESLSTHYCWALNYPFIPS